MKRRVMALACVLSAWLALSGPARAGAPLRRVFIYVLENTSYEDVVGHRSSAPYLNSLVDRFVLATHYTAAGHASLDNYIAMTSGQPPNPATMADCPVYAPPLCIQDVPNIADQLESGGRTWRAYMDGMPAPCVHPAENSPDTYQRGYATRHNPFVYYRSIVGNPQRCRAHVVPLTELWEDQRLGRVPDYVFVTPDTCHDGHDSGPPCRHGGGLREADWFASQTIPRILADPSWRDGGLLVVTFDEGGSSVDVPKLGGGNVDFGGHIYTVLAWPQAPAGAHFDEEVDHYALLRGVEDLFCLSPLGGARASGSLLDATGQRRCELASAPPPTSTPRVAAVVKTAPQGALPSPLPVTGVASRPVLAWGLAVGGLALLARRGARSRRP